MGKAKREQNNKMLVSGLEQFSIKGLTWEQGCNGVKLTSLQPSSTIRSSSNEEAQSHFTMTQSRTNDKLPLLVFLISS
jgi:hypothetical protein